MSFEGVSLNEGLIKSMTEEAFVAEVTPVFWQDREEADREKLARQAYELICPKPKKDKAKK